MRGDYLAYIRPSNGHDMLGFFDVMFKKGVEDAASCGDAFEVRAFHDDRTEDWRFGSLDVEGEMTWHDYQFLVYRAARMTGYKTLAEEFISAIWKMNYNWCFLPYCMRFYLLGIGEWLAYPNPSGLAYFKTWSGVHWDPNTKMPRKFTRMDYISYMHGFAFEYRRLPEAERYVTPKVMDNFTRAIYDVTKKYASNSRLRSLAKRQDKGVQGPARDAGEDDWGLDTPTVWGVLPSDEGGDGGEGGRHGGLPRRGDGDDKERPPRGGEGPD